MGARHSSTSSAYYHNRSLVTGPAAGGGEDGGRQFAQEILESCDPQLAEQYSVDGYLYPGSGRMMRTFRLRHKKNGSLVVVKLMWVTFDFDDDDHEPEDDRELDPRSNGSNGGIPPNATTRMSTAQSRGTAGLQGQQRELLRVFRALKRNSHMSPFLYWKAGPETFRPNYTNNSGNAIAIRPAILLRPYFYTTLSDRLASRPFLTHVEKLWIVYQLLRALDDLHNSTSRSATSSSLNDDNKQGNIDSSPDGVTDTTKNYGRITTTATATITKTPIVHGFLTTENVGLSSWNWVVLLDLSASYKGRTALPDDDPSEYLYYFQERQTGSAQSNNSASTNINDSNNNNNTSFPTSAQSGGGPHHTSSLSSATSASSPLDFNNMTNNHIDTSTATREKRCYLAPERFYTPGNNRNKGDERGDASGSASAASSSTKTASSSKPTAQMLTPAMDIFSAGCVIMETFLNGERAFDLGDLMEYRQRKAYTPTLQQKLNKIEFSALRAACKHMLSLDPSQRLSARAYLKRLEASGLIPTSFDTLARLMNEVTTNANSESSSTKDIEVEVEATVVTPDARLAKAAACYSEILYETMGILDKDGKAYFDKVLGRTAVTVMRNMDASSDGNTETNTIEINQRQQKPGISFTAMTEEKKESEEDSLFAETNALLRELEALTIDEDEVVSMASEEAADVKRRCGVSKKEGNVTGSKDPNQSRIRRSQLSENSLLIYLQLVLSTVRHVQRPASKLVALQLMKRVGQYTTDEARLQRIVPVTVSLLQDQDPLVRASAIEVLISTISIVESFPPSDSKVFPQYIFKRVAHLVTDPSLVVRLSFARNVAMLAETAHRFLDISHAVRLYEAVGGGSANVTNGSQKDSGSSSDVFGDDIAKLLGESSSPSTKNENKKILNGAESTETTASDIMGSARALISSTYNSDLGVLHETVSRWVIHITTDVSEHSSPAKRALLADMARLCNFFGLDGVMAFILPQVLSFLNDRKDWQLRASLFEHLQSVCHFIGRAATEHFVLPILETALVDSEEVVISRALLCLSELLGMGLLSRGIFLGRKAVHGFDESPGYVHNFKLSSRLRCSLYIRCVPSQSNFWIIVLLLVCLKSTGRYCYTLPWISG
jgi:phosphoinositide-3-kinase regulatory subunit 4